MYNQKNNEDFFAKTILVAEDDEISFLVLSEFLKMNNYRVSRAVNGKDAVSLIKNAKNSFCLVLMDIIMPVMDGFEAAKKIKEINQDIPIIAQTSVALNWTNKGDFSKFNYIMQKPLDIQKLGKLIFSSINKNNILKTSNLLLS